MISRLGVCWTQRPPATIIVTVLAAGFCYFLNDGLSYAFGIIYSDLRVIFENSAATTAVLPAMVDAVPQFSAIVTCPFVQATGSGLSALIGGFMVALGFFTSSFVNSLLPLYFTIGVLSAVGLELVYVAALGAVATATSSHRGLAVGLTVCCSSVGTIFFSFMLPLLLDYYFWAGTFIIVSGIFLNIFITAIIFYYHFDKMPDTRSLIADEDREILVEADDNDSNDFIDDTSSITNFCQIVKRFFHQFYSSVRQIFTLHLWSNVKFLAFIFNEFIHGLSMVVPESLLYDSLIATGHSQWEAATIQAIFSAFSTVGHLVWGIIADRISPIKVYCFAQLFTALTIIPIVYIHYFGLLVCLVAAAGFFRGYNETLFSLIIIQDLGETYFYSGLVVLLTVVGAGNMIGTPLGGYIFDQTQSYSLAFVLAGCILFGSTVILFAVRSIADFVTRSRSLSHQSEVA